jgi:hypothetical protein
MLIPVLHAVQTNRQVQQVYADPERFYQDKTARASSGVVNYDISMLYLRRRAIPESSIDGREFDLRI